MKETKEKHNDMTTDLVMEITGAKENKRVLSCIQCGTCTATCPMNNLFEESPRQIFLMVRNGMVDGVFNSITPWICASCYKCTINCPAGVKITDVMYKIKRLGIQNNRLPHTKDIRAFYGSFLGLIRKYGRSYEAGLMIKYFLFNHPVDLLKRIPVGMQMFFAGTMPLFPHRIKDSKGFKKMLEHASKYDFEVVGKN
ncbi:MAG: 4Fe-4S dicluster domain-containing protein [Bacteroidota bacterium]